MELTHAFARKLCCGVQGGSPVARARRSLGVQVDFLESRLMQTGGVAELDSSLQCAVGIAGSTILGAHTEVSSHEVHRSQTYRTEP